MAGVSTLSNFRPKLAYQSFGQLIIGPVHPAYNPYFSTCFAVRTVFFSHNKLANSVFSRLISIAERGHVCARMASDAGMDDRLGTLNALVQPRTKR
jgi:hypothetical protein